MDMPDSPEAVALALFFYLLAMRAEEQRNQPTPVSTALDLFAECMAAVRGDREGRRRH